MKYETALYRGLMCTPQCLAMQLFTSTPCQQVSLHILFSARLPIPHTIILPWCSTFALATAVLQCLCCACRTASMTAALRKMQDIKRSSEISITLTYCAIKIQTPFCVFFYSPTFVCFLSWTSLLNRCVQLSTKRDCSSSGDLIISGRSMTATGELYAV